MSAYTERRTPSSPQELTRRVLDAAVAQDQIGLQAAATAVFRTGNRADARDVLAMVAWTAGCFARRLEPGLVQQLRDGLAAAHAAETRRKGLGS